MAYMNQERKASIHAALKRVIPKNWKWSLAVRHHSSIVLTIAAAPHQLSNGHESLNPYHWERQHADKVDWTPEVVEIFKAIFSALNRGNHNNSDIMTDYFDVGWYVEVDLGRWDKPFVNLAAAAKEADAEVLA